MGIYDICIIVIVAHRHVYHSLAANEAPRFNIEFIGGVNVAIRTKVLLSALISLMFALFCTIVVVREYLVTYLHNEEMNSALQNLTRAASIIQREETALESIQLDWSQWDDAYQFIKDRNTNFIKVNIQEEALEALKLNFMMFADSEYNVAAIVETGKEIPRLSRLLAVVDSFDVMTHDRVYKKAMDIESAIRELKDCSGTQFDPEMVEAFVETINKDSLVEAM